MKTTYRLAIFLFLLAGIGGYLLSNASLVGRVGIGLFYTEYKFLKIWWQSGSLLFFIWVVLFLLQGWLQKRTSSHRARMMNIAALILAFTGLYFTYNDFQHTLSHRLLGTKFHLGVYIFWIGWMIVSLYYLTKKKTLPIPMGNLNRASIGRSDRDQ